MSGVSLIGFSLRCSLYLSKDISVQNPDGNFSLVSRACQIPCVSFPDVFSLITNGNTKSADL